MNRLISLLCCVMISFLCCSPCYAFSANVRYAGHVIKKIVLLPVYLMVANPVAVGVWITYGGYEKQLWRDYNNNVLNGVNAPGSSDDE